MSTVLANCVSSHAAHSRLRCDPTGSRELQMNGNHLTGHKIVP